MAGAESGNLRGQGRGHADTGKELLVETRSPIRIITPNRPEALNKALTTAVDALLAPAIGRETATFLEPASQANLACTRKKSAS